ncbi:MAG TPA: hypothetical protein VFG58_04625, partial [Solirubrobacterales bacterium]|nr:hypothetical protein [Solirubrobacterales bacterium]
MPSHVSVLRAIPVGVERLVLFRRALAATAQPLSTEKVKWNPYRDRSPDQRRRYFARVSSNGNVVTATDVSRRYGEGEAAVDALV